MAKIDIGGGIPLHNTELQRGPVWVNKTWKDPRLPEQFEAYRWQAVYKGLDIKSGSFRFDGIDFGIPVNKMPNLRNLQSGDIIEVIKLRYEGSDYDGDGIICVANMRTKETSDYAMWQKMKEDEMEKIRESVRNNR